MKQPLKTLASCFGYTWVNAYNTLEVIGQDGIDDNEAKIWVETRKKNSTSRPQLLAATCLIRSYLFAASLSINAIRELSSPQLSQSVSPGQEWIQPTGSSMPSGITR